MSNEVESKLNGTATSSIQTGQNPHQNFQNIITHEIGNILSSDISLNSEDKKIDRAKTPPKRKSIMTITTFGVSVDDKIINPSLYHRKPTDQEMTTDKKTSVSSKCNAEDIIDLDTEEKIETNLTKLWELAQLNSQERINFYENEISDFLNSIYQEKYERSIEIHSKYEKEVKELQNDVDLSKNFSF
jgi:hypothetical protein